MAPTDDRAYRHGALLYAGDAEFVDAVVPYIREGLDANEPTLVVVQRRKIDLLREALGDATAEVRLADMTSVGANPARIIPEWRRFVTAHEGNGRVRGVGEPLYAERQAAERAECHVHEALLNLALSDAPLSLLCPYDIDALPSDDIERAIDNHPIVHAGAHKRENTEYGATIEWFGGDLPEPPVPAERLEFDLGTLSVVRGMVEVAAHAFGLDNRQRHDCVLAVSEIATNSLLHGGGRGSFRCWAETDRFVCEVADRGRIVEPLVGRVQPVRGQVGGYGVWLANQLADLVQIRSNAQRTVVRLHVLRERVDH
jgi:anti-sigma regulatory factor (Ser/Thr protein kinase)